MRKTAAYFVSILFLISGGLAVLHPSYETIASWLSPLLGSHLYMVLTVFSLLMLDPLRYMSVGLVWLIAGLIIGLISQKRLGSAITAVFSWLSLIPILGASFYGICLNIESSMILQVEPSEALKYIPVIPSSISLESFFEVPIFSELAIHAISLASTMDESMDPMSLIMDIAMQYLTPVLMKPIIIVSGAILGTVLAKILFSQNGFRLPTRKTATAMILLISTCFTPMLVNALNYQDGLYVEALGGVIEPEGRSLSGQIVVSSEIETVSSYSAKQNLIASIVLTQRIHDPRVLYSLPIPGLSDFLPIVNVAPSTYAVTVYADTDEVSVEQKTRQLIDEYESVYGIDFHKIISTPMKFEENDESLPSMTVTVYYSLDPFEKTASSLTTTFNENAGITETIDEIIQGDPLDIESYFTGMIDPEYLRPLLPITDPPPGFEEPFEAILGSKYSFLAGIQMIKDGANANEDGYNLMDTLGISVPRYSSESDISLVLVSRYNMSNPDIGQDPDTKLATSLPPASIELLLLTMFLPGGGFIDFKTGEAPDVSDLRIAAPSLNVPKVNLEKNVQKSGKTSIYTLSATNNGLNTIENVKLYDPFPDKYDILDSGTNIATWERLRPGEKQSLSYQTTTVNPGLYSDTPALLSWDGEIVTSISPSNLVESYKVEPNALSLLLDNYRASSSLIDLATGGKGYLLNLVVVGFIGLIALIDLYKYMRRRSTSEPPTQEESSLPEQPSDGDNPQDLL